ncbi:MAG: DNA polymerase [Hyphomicrobiaceae bacterium]
MERLAFRDGLLTLSSRAERYQHLSDIFASGQASDDTDPFVNVHEARKTREGRARLRSMGKTRDKNSLDMSSRPFVGWDGEGITYVDGTPQSYVLFGASTGDYVIGEDLRTKQCLDLMLKVKFKNPHAIMVGFMISYDAEMIMKDFTPAHLTRIHKHTVVRWGNYRVEFIPKKWLQVSGTYAGRKLTCRIWDVWSFFTSSFVKALEQYLPDDVTQDELDMIITGKGQRGKFTVEKLRSEVVPYWQKELVLLVRLMERLRELLHKVQIYPKMWHGPAAIANFLNKRAKTDKYMNRNLPDGVLDASQFAYAAGRVEQYKVGRAQQRVYKYDLNSAYPAAMVELPALTGEWRFRQADHIADIQMFGMYYVEYTSLHAVGSLFPQALFHRTKDGYITFPRLTNGWYWGPEAIQAIKLNSLIPDQPVCRIRAAWEMDCSNVKYPFEWVQDMYDERVGMKKRKEQSQLALKLGLNSLYGKTAQRTGYDRFKKIPEWHQYEWSGYITSRTRARMFEAACLAAERGALIGIETDAVFSTVPLPELKVGENLGEWGFEVFDDCVYLQTGVYWLLEDGKWKPKFRGMDKDTLTLDMALEYLDSTSMNVRHIDDYEKQAMTGMTRTRFVGSKAALHVNKLENWRVWKTDPVQLSIGKSFKRIHVPALCHTCNAGEFFASETMHDMAVTLSGMGGSHASKLPWREVDGEASLWDHPEETEADPSFIP